MDLDDFDAPIQPLAKPSRFAPKSKSQPKSKKPVPVKVDTPPVPVKVDDPPVPVKVDTPDVVAVKKEEESQALSSAFNAMEVDGSGVQAKVEEERAAANEDGVVEEEEEDQIVAEYDVYCSPSDDDNQLYVLQYPLRPSWRPYDMEKCTEVRVKPKSAQMEIDLLVDTDDNYNSESNLAAKMTKQTLSSRWSPPQATGYCVGVVMGKKELLLLKRKKFEDAPGADARSLWPGSTNGSFHYVEVLFLNPIHSVIQLRPSMEYLDSDSKKRSISDTTIKAEGSSRKQSKPMEPEVVEPWVSLKYHDATHEVSERCRRKMVTEEHNPIKFPMPPNNYLKSLCPGTTISKSKPKGPSRRFLDSLPLEKRLMTQLAEGPPIQRFNSIKHIVPDDPVEEVLQILQKYGQLIQGLWVAKTAVRLPNGPGPEALTRDYVLLKFSESPIIKESELEKHLGSRRSVAKIALREVANERTSCKDWKFKEPKDLSFMKLYPHVVEQQEKLWQDRRTQMEAKIPSLKDGAKRPENTGKPNVAKATNGARSSSMFMSKETLEALPKALGKIFQARKVCSFQTICQALREDAVKQSQTDPRGRAAAVAAARSVDAPHEELHTAICEVAEFVNGVYLVKSSMDHPERNQLRGLVVRLLRVAPDGKLKKGAIIEASKMEFDKEPTNNEFHNVINEYCVSNGGSWVLKNGDAAPI